MNKRIGNHHVHICCEVSDKDYFNPALEAQILLEKAEKLASTVSGGNLFLRNSLDDLLIPRDTGCHLKKVI